MTAAETRAALVEAMPREWTTMLVRDRVADALTPTVQQLIAQAVTTALNDAADELSGPEWDWTGVADQIRSRARTEATR